MANIIDSWRTDKCHPKFEAVSDPATIAAGEDAAVGVYGRYRVLRRKDSQGCQARRPAG